MYVALLPLAKYKIAFNAFSLCVKKGWDAGMAEWLLLLLQLEMEREKADKSVSEVCTRQQVKKASQTRNVCCRLRCRL